jgi:hypothetical protein
MTNQGGPRLRVMHYTGRYDALYIRTGETTIYVILKIIRKPQHPQNRD